MSNEFNINLRKSVVVLNQNTNVRFSPSLEKDYDLSRYTGRQTSSMMDLRSSTQQRGLLQSQSRIALGARAKIRQNQEARNTRSFLSQSLSDVRPREKGSWVRDDQFLSNRGYGITGSSSGTTPGQRLFSSRSPSSSFHGRSLSGFDASQSSGFLQSLASLRNDHFFLPSVGILGGVSQTRSGGAFGNSMLGSYSGFQSLTTGPTVLDGHLYNSASLGDLQQQTSSQVLGSSLNSARQGFASGFNGRLYNSANVGNLQQQFSHDVQETSMNAASQQASFEVANNSEGSRLNVTASSGGFHQVATSQQAEVGGSADASYVAGSSGGSQPQSVVSHEVDLKDSVNIQSQGNLLPPNCGGQAVGESQQVSTSLQMSDLVSLGNDVELTVQSEDQVVDDTEAG